MDRQAIAPCTPVGFGRRTIGRTEENHQNEGRQHRAHHHEQGVHVGHAVEKRHRAHRDGTERVARDERGDKAQTVAGTAEGKELLDPEQEGPSVDRAHEKGDHAADDGGGLNVNGCQDGLGRPAQQGRRNIRQCTCHLASPQISLTGGKLHPQASQRSSQHERGLDEEDRAP